MAETVRIPFAAAGDFNAMRQAEAYLAQHGFSVGPTQGKAPRAIKHGNWKIAKWRNLTAAERRDVDGRMEGDMRSGPVWVTIRLDCLPEPRRATA